MKKGILMGLTIVMGLMLGGSVYAQESNTEVMQEGSMQISVEETSIEENNSEALQAIATQLADLEEEINKLSLLVSKIVLEQQALVLQEQLDALIAIAQVTPQAAEEANIESSSDATAIEENVAEETVMEEATEVAVMEEPIQESDEQESIITRSAADELNELPIPIVAVDEGNSGGGSFLAQARGLLNNIGTPEIVTVLILAVLAIFVILRRVTSRAKKVSVPVKSDSQPTETQQNTIDEKRQEIQEKVAWK